MGNCCVKEKDEEEKKPKQKKSKNPSLRVGANRYKVNDDNNSVVAPADGAANDDGTPPKTPKDRESGDEERSGSQPSTARERPKRPLPSVVSLSKTPPSRELGVPRPGSAAIQPNGSAMTRATAGDSEQQPTTPAASVELPLSPLDVTTTQPPSMQNRGPSPSSPSVTQPPANTKPVVAPTVVQPPLDKGQPQPSATSTSSTASPTTAAATTNKTPTVPLPTSALAAMIVKEPTGAAASSEGGAAAQPTDNRTATADGRPKMIEFELNFDNDDDLLHIDEMSEEAIEAFDAGTDTSTKETTPQKKKNDITDNNNDSSKKDASKSPTANPNKKQQNVPPSTPKLDKQWFLDRGVYPPKEVLWSQTKSTVTVRISPADATSGWEYDPKRRVLEFNGIGPKGTVAVSLPLYRALHNPDFQLDTLNGCLVFSGTKFAKEKKSSANGQSADSDDEEDEEESSGGGHYWVQLLRGSRKDYAALPFIRRDILDEDDDDDDAAMSVLQRAEKAEKAAKHAAIYNVDYTKRENVSEEVEAFSDPDDM